MVVADVPKKLYTSHLLAVVVCTGVVSPVHISKLAGEVAQVIAPATALGLHTVSFIWEPDRKPVRVMVVAAPPIWKSCEFPSRASIVFPVVVAILYSVTRIEEEAIEVPESPQRSIVNFAQGLVVPIPTLPVEVNMVNKGKVLVANVFGEVEEIENMPFMFLKLRSASVAEPSERVSCGCEDEAISSGHLGEVVPSPIRVVRNVPEVSAALPLPKASVPTPNLDSPTSATTAPEPHFVVPSERFV